VQTAREVAALNGLPDYPFVVVGHPIANDRDADLRAKAEAAVARLVPLLTGPPRFEPPAAASGRTGRD
jgi:hypothetical protein